MCFIADVAVLPRWLSVSNAIEYAEAVHPRFSRERAMHFLERTKIKQKSKVGELSKGMVTQLHLALIMAIDAKLLVLDEPTLGLDILYRKEFYTSLLNDYFDAQAHHPRHHPPGGGDREDPHPPHVHRQRPDHPEQLHGAGGRELHRGAGGARQGRRRPGAEAAV